MTKPERSLHSYRFHVLEFAYTSGSNGCAILKSCSLRYYDILEHTQKGDLDITDWLAGFLDRLHHAIIGAETILASVMHKAEFWEKHADAYLNARQKLMLNKLLSGFEGKLTSSKWAKVTKTSRPTASRDIDQLLKLGILSKNAGGGRSTSYWLVED